MITRKDIEDIGFKFVRGNEIISFFESRNNRHGFSLELKIRYQAESFINLMEDKKVSVVSLETCFEGCSYRLLDRFETNDIDEVKFILARTTRSWGALYMPLCFDAYKYSVSA